MKRSAILLSLAMLMSTVSCGGKAVSSASDTGKAQGIPDLAGGTRTESTTEASGEKITIKLAVAESPDWWRGWQLVWDKLNKFNSESDKYYVDVVIYSIDEDDKFGDTSAQRLSMDILADDVPDIIAAAPFQLDKFRKNGYLTDLSQYIHREDFLGNVISSVEQDGKIQMIYPTFEIYTAAARTALVGADKENWTVQDAVGAYNSFSGDLISNMYTKYDLRHYFFKGVMASCIDYKSHTCDLENGLAPVLSFLSSIPDTGNRNTSGEAAGDVTSGTALVQEMWINGINTYYPTEMLRCFGNEPVTFVGYPTSSGKGSYADVADAFGIMANSPHQSEAWDVLAQTIFSDEFQMDLNTYSYGVPVSKNAVEELMSGFGAPFKSTKPEAPVNEEQRVLTEEQKQQFYDLLSSIVIDPFINVSIEYMIKEESDYVFDGGRNIDECIDILQNRIGLYLSETE